MSNILKGSLLFIAGAAVSSLITYKVVEKKFKKIADEEIESVKAMYKRKMNKIMPEHKLNKTTLKDFSEVKEEMEKNIAPIDVIKTNPYSSLVTDLGYSDKKKEERKDMDVNNIEVIPPEDFGEYGYKCESLTYYADKVLTFDDDERIADVNEFVGPDALNTFGEYEDDSVFVRNHGMKTDFEILLDSRNYSAVFPDDSINDGDYDE